MKELIDLKRAWDWCVSKWATSFGCVLLIVVSFVIGTLVEEKRITDDCKFSKNFRDGSTVYECQMRMR